MIGFSCAHCGMKFQVKTQFAGRATKCPTCKQPLVVPPPSQTEAYVPAEKIDGTQSSLDQAGVDGGVSLDEQRAGSVSDRSSQKTVRELLAQRPKNGGRYVIAGEIARGGMGAVLRAVDCDIRREVAVKFMLDDRDPKKKLRFIEEAQITGQLAHPNIVPIYELGVDSQKRPFFSMKKVEGRSLKDVLDQLRDHPKQAEKDWTLARLLTLLVSVCNGLAFAHSRGVIHRDLKPANIMVGDFGEVYIMDFGLAKVLGREEAAPAAGPAATVASVGVKRSSKVETSRQEEADLTQEGAILGTPVYMPPEQANGKPHEIDQRSDVYSLGAILYEMLTLQPPVEKGDGYLAILMRVIQGEIVPPEQHTPDRAKRGKIPRELSAIAMKALARDAKDRYPNVEALRRDIERFQEGRSVSAKPDSVREFAWKLVKRNKAISTVAALALVLVAIIGGWSAWSTYHERQDKIRHARTLIPAYMRAAEVSVADERLDDALGQIAFALEYEREHPEALLLRGKVHIVRQEFTQGRADLDRYVRQRKDDQLARKLAEMCQQANAEDATTLAPFVTAFLQNGEYPLAKAMRQWPDKILAYYREPIEAAWPGLGKQLTIDGSGKLRLDLAKLDKQVKDLRPLKGIPLTSLNLEDCLGIEDLTPLQGMPLTSLNLRGAGGNRHSLVKDLTPLQGMPLTSLDLGLCPKIKDLTPLQGMPLTSLILDSCGANKDLTQLKGIQLRSLSLGYSPVHDLTPLKEMPLTSLSLHYCRQIRDLSPLQDMPLTSLNLWNCQVQDLSPLKGMPLTSLNLSDCGQVQDLSPLKGMPLTSLNLSGCGQIQDLTPLAEMKLASSH